MANQDLSALSVRCEVRQPVVVRIHDRIPADEVRGRYEVSTGESEWVEDQIEYNQALLDAILDHPEILKKYIRREVTSLYYDYFRPDKSPLKDVPSKLDILGELVEKELTEEAADHLLYAERYGVEGEPYGPPQKYDPETGAALKSFGSVIRPLYDAIQIERVESELDLSALETEIN